MRNHADSKDILTDQQKIEKVTESKYLGQTTHLRHYKRRHICQDQSSVELFWKKTRKYSKMDNSSFHLKNK